MHHLLKIAPERLKITNNIKYLYYFKGSMLSITIFVYNGPYIIYSSDKGGKPWVR